jgi:hypothetical protein
MRLLDRSAEQLPDLIRSVLDSLLGSAQPDMQPIGDLRAALRVTCERARDDGVRAEQLLLVLKATWHDLPGRRQLPHLDGDAVLARLVTACIAEYYDDDPNERQRAGVRASPSPRRDGPASKSAEIH